MVEIDEKDALSILELTRETSQVHEILAVVKSIRAQVDSLKSMVGIARLIDQLDYEQVTLELEAWLHSIESDLSARESALNMWFGIPDEMPSDASDIPF